MQRSSQARPAKSAVRLDNNGSGAVFRFRDDGADLELLLEGMRAPFALGFTPFGRLWVITNGEGSPNCLLDAVRGTDYRFRNRGPNDWSWLTGAEPLAAPAWENPPGAHTAVLPYYSSAFPEQYWGNLFVSNFGVHGEPAKKNEVLRLILDDRGRVVRREPFISSSDPKFRPTQVSLAPDGSLYMLDWYGKDDENDLTGRLYRIRYTGKNALSNNGGGLENRNHAQRAKSKAALLAAGPSASLPVIGKALSGDDALAAAEALWTLRQSGWTSASDHIRVALSHQDWRVRRLALQLLREMDRQQNEELRKLQSDLDPAVQIEAALGFRDAAARCTALVQTLRGGAAKIRRLRFMAALEIARYGQDEHFAALLTADDPDVRLAGLIALDEAFYESSKGFKTPDADAELAEETCRTRPEHRRAQVPGTIAAALALAPERRSVAQERELAALHSSTLTELNPLREELKRLEQLKNELSTGGVAPALTARRVLARFIAEPGILDAAELIDLARRWPHASLKNAVDGIVKTRLTAEKVTVIEFAQGLDALKRMELPMSNANILKARIRLLDSAEQRDFRQAEEALALLAVLEAGTARSEDLSLLKRFSTDEDASVRAKAGSLISTRHAGDAAAVTFCRDLASSDSAGLPQRLDALVTLTKLEKTPHEGDWQMLLLSPRKEVVLASLRGLQSGSDRAAARRILENAAPACANNTAPWSATTWTFATAVLGGKNIAGTDKTELRRHVLADLSTGSPELGRLVFRMRGCYACHVTGDPKVRAPRLDQDRGDARCGLPDRLDP